MINYGVVWNNSFERKFLITSSIHTLNYIKKLVRKFKKVLQLIIKWDII
jgi:hypothetical protein